MQTQRDHVHAHQFQMGRMSSALVFGDPGSDEIPARRALTGLLVGVLVGVLALAGFAVYGWLVPGGDTSWREPGAIVVEKQTGNRFVYLGGRLRPVPNLTSAMLLSDGGTVRLVSAASLASTPRGPMIGLVDAPQSPPDPKALVAGPWLACTSGSDPVTAPVPAASRSAGPDPDPAGDRSIGLNLDPAAVVTPLGADRFVLIGDHLVLGGVKYRLGDRTVPAALGIAGEPAVPADGDWIDALPDGPVIAPARLPGEGTPGPSVDGSRSPIGQLFRQDGPGGTFILTERGLVPVDRIEAVLLEAAGRSVRPVSAAQVAASVRAGDRSLTGRLPDLLNTRIERLDGRAVCLRQRFADGRLTTEVVLTDQRTAGFGPEARILPPGAGMVVFGLPVEQRQNGRDVPLHLISDEGVIHPLADDESRRALRLGDVTPVGMPVEFLSRMPVGPVLSRSAATVTRTPAAPIPAATPEEGPQE